MWRIFLVGFHLLLRMFGGSAFVIKDRIVSFCGCDVPCDDGDERKTIT